MPRPAKGYSDRGQLRDSQLLDVAAQVIYKHGYSATSVQMLADELGILKGSLYYYMRSKDDLLYRLLEEVHNELAGRLERAKAATHLDPLERLAEYVRDQVDYAARHVQLVTIYYREVDHLPEPARQAIFARRDEHGAFVREVIAEAQAAGKVRVEDSPNVLANLVFGSFVWTYRWYDVAGSLSPAELADACARFALRAITER